MKILILIFLILINFFSISYGSVKQDIILNLKNINNITFNFKQTINDKTDEGLCIIKYPRKIFCEYDNIKKKIIISNGKSLVIKNQSNNQYYRYKLESTPLILILDKSALIERIFKNEFELVEEKYIKFSIKNNNNIINVFFDKNSYNLIGWQTEDLYQNLIITFIYNLKKNENIDEKIFKLPEL